MKTVHRLFTMFSALALLCIATGSVAKEDIDTRASLEHFQQAPQTQPFFESAYGYAIFPSIGKGGFWVGGAYGTGTVYQGQTITGFAKLYQVSVGLQFGGQSYSQIMFFQDQRSYERFVSGSFELDAQASAVALTEGAQARAGTTGVGAGSGKNFVEANYTNGMAIFTYAKGGMMIEASLAGQKFSYEPISATTEQVKDLNQRDTDQAKQGAPVSDLTSPVASDSDEPTVILAPPLEK
ncbi:YSC84-related protein [Photobacterium kagoshimensis]|uniref:lipid-binding SYLF domain-containing protein n=1 Tax=Photobacterium kagoshimensis TaxID=2910242 RepID=UPI003D0E4468